MRKNLKQWLSLAVSCAMLLGVTACSGTTDVQNSDDNDTQAASTSSNEKYKIGYVSAAFSDDYCKRLADAFVACSNDEVEVTALDGNLDPAQIISCIETFKTQGVDALIVQPIGNVPDATLWCNEQDVPLVFCNIQPILSDTTQDLEYYYIGSSEEAIGAQEAEALASGLDEGAKICLLMLPLGQDNQIRRTNGFEDWLAENRPDYR